jgi:hypothetical protein
MPALTSTVTKTITQYRLDSVLIDFEASRVHVSVSRLDAAGQVVDSSSFGGTFAELGITALEGSAIQNRIITFLKSKSFIN